MRYYPTTGRYFSLNPKPGRMQGPLSAGPSDTTAPTITAVSLVSQTYNPYLHRLCGISLKVEFSESMDEATGSGVTASLTIGGVSKTATYVGWIDGSLYLTYVLDGSEKGSISVSSPLVLASGTLKDVAGNNATLTFSPPDTSSLVALLRGVQYGSTFEQGADAQKVYGVARNITLSSAQARRGSSTGSDSADFAWGTNGAEFDGGDYASMAAWPFTFDHIDDPDDPWSWHVRFKRGTPSGNPEPFFCTHGGSGYGTYHFVQRIGGTDYLVSYSDSGGLLYSVGVGSFIAAGDWATVSVTCAGGAGGAMKAYLNGSQISTGTWQPPTDLGSALSASNILLFAGATDPGWIQSPGAVIRALYTANVTHDATEVADIHTFLSALAS